ncbi:hypothetical protein YC2023_115218 [Brassica napus]
MGRGTRTKTEDSSASERLKTDAVAVFQSVGLTNIVPPTSQNVMQVLHLPTFQNHTTRTVLSHTHILAVVTLNM